jgi:N,N'-diacetyllegionaminate synthase
MRGMNIAGRQVGHAHPPYIIAEIGVNHDGSTERAIELAIAAADAGADAVKFQLFSATGLMSANARLAAYQKAAGERDPVAMLARLELASDALAAAADAARRRGAHAIVSVFNLELVAEAERVGWDAYKTASPDIINRPLLLALAGTGKPLICSTGAAERGEIARALAWLRRFGTRLAILQCVSSYPARPQDACLRAIADLSRLHPGPVGYSDHTPGTHSGALAVAAGACILEKHFTYDRAAPGPDHAASLDPAGFAEYVRLARDAWEMLGDPRKRVLACEADVRNVSRQSVVAVRDLAAGHTLTRADLTLKRPGGGIEPSKLDDLAGLRLRNAVGGDTVLRPEDVEGLGEAR